MCKPINNDQQCIKAMSKKKQQWNIFQQYKYCGLSPSLVSLSISFYCFLFSLFIFICSFSWINQLLLMQPTTNAKWSLNRRDNNSLTTQAFRLLSFSWNLGCDCSFSWYLEQFASAGKFSAEISIAIRRVRSRPRNPPFSMATRCP